MMVKLSPRRFLRHAGAQSALDYQIVATSVLQRIRHLAVQPLAHSEGNEKAGPNETVKAGKGRRGDADDGENDSVDAQAAADGGAVTRVVLLPEVVADHRHRLGGCSRFLRQKRAAG